MNLSALNIYLVYGKALRYGFLVAMSMSILHGRGERKAMQDN